MPDGTRAVFRESKRGVCGAPRKSGCFGDDAGHFFSHRGEQW